MNRGAGYPREYRLELEIRERDRLMDEIERLTVENYNNVPEKHDEEESLRNFDGSLNHAAILRRWNRVGRRKRLGDGWRKP